jgi:hypothetical protein
MYTPLFLPDRYPSQLEHIMQPHTNQTTKHPTNQRTEELRDFDLLQRAIRRPSICLAIFLGCTFYPVPRTLTLSHMKPSSAGNPVRAALLWTTVQDCVLPCDPVNTSRYVVWWLCCFTVRWSDRKASCLAAG